MTDTEIGAVEETAVTIIHRDPEDLRLIRMVDDFDAALIVQGVNEDLVENWCYCFRQAGGIVLGLSVKGVQAAAREMSKHGEVVRLEGVATTFEDEEEIRLVGTAIRWFVNSDGVMVETDRSIRALRQPKKQTINDYTGTGNDRRRSGSHLEPDPKWYEKAYSKACRNAMLPLIRADCQSAILNAFKATPKYLDVVNNRPGTNANAPARSQARERQNAQPRAASGPAIPAQPAATQTVTTAADLAKAQREFAEAVAYIKGVSEDVYRETLATIRASFPHVVNSATQGISPSAFTAADVEQLAEIMTGARRRVDGAPPVEDSPPPDDDESDPGPDEPEVS